MKIGHIKTYTREHAALKYSFTEKTHVLDGVHLFGEHKFRGQFFMDTCFMDIRFVATGMFRGKLFREHMELRCLVDNVIFLY